MRRKDRSEEDVSAESGAPGRRPGDEVAAEASRAGGRESPAPDTAEASSRREAASAEGARSARMERRQIEKMAEKMVKAVRVGRDEQRRRVVMLEVEVPGRGDVSVRMRRDGEGYAVRFRADDESLEKDLEQQAGTLREAAQDRGVTVSTIETAGQR